MIKDSLREYSVAQAITATGVSTNALDNGSELNNPSQFLVSRARVAGTGAGTIQAVLQHSSDNSTFSDVLAGEKLVGSSIKAGTDLLYVKYPKSLKRYTRINYVVVGTATVTADSFDAFND